MMRRRPAVNTSPQLRVHQIERRALPACRGPEQLVQKRARWFPQLVPARLQDQYLFESSDRDGSCVSFLVIADQVAGWSRTWHRRSGARFVQVAIDDDLLSFAEGAGSVA